MYYVFICILPDADKRDAKDKSDIWYQYKEGYNNAVRKKIQISTLK